MNILDTVNSNYLHPLKVMLRSMFFDNPNQQFYIYLIHSQYTLTTFPSLSYSIPLAKESGNFCMGNPMVKLW